MINFFKKSFSKFKEKVKKYKEIRKQRKAEEIPPEYFSYPPYPKFQKRNFIKTHKIFRKFIFFFLTIIAIGLIIFFGSFLFSFFKSVTGTLKEYELTGNPIIDAIKEGINAAKTSLKNLRETYQCLMNPFECPAINPWKNVKASESEEVLEERYGITVLKVKYQNSGFISSTSLNYGCTACNGIGCQLTNEQIVTSISPYVSVSFRASFPEKKNIKATLYLSPVYDDSGRLLSIAKSYKDCPYVYVATISKPIPLEKLDAYVKKGVLIIYSPISNISTSYLFPNPKENNYAVKDPDTGKYYQFRSIVADAILNVSYNAKTNTDSYILLVRDSACAAADLEDKTIWDYLKVSMEKYVSKWTGDPGIYGAAGSMDNYICLNIKRKQKIPIFIALRKAYPDVSIVSINNVTIKISPAPSNITSNLNITPNWNKKEDYIVININNLENITSSINEKGEFDLSLELIYDTTRLKELFKGKDYINLYISVNVNSNITKEIPITRIRIDNSQT